MNDLEFISHIVDDEYMLGAFFVRSTITGETFVIDPSVNGPFTLYFDNELFCWMVDCADYLVWDNDQQKWVS